MDASIVHPREVFKPAIKNSASKIVLVHNHPGGDCEASKEDLEIFGRLSEVGEGLGIKILDNIIISNNKKWSWKENV